MFVTNDLNILDLHAMIEVSIHSLVAKHGVTPPFYLINSPLSIFQQHMNQQQIWK